MKSFPIVVSLGVVASLALPARAESPADIPNPQRARLSWVADNADVLSSSTERKLDDLINGVKKRTGAEIAVVTVRNLGGRSVEDFANDLFNRWGIGRKSDDDGVLILAAMSERKLRIEIGDGAESRITDGQAGQIIRAIINPNFRAGDFDGGLYNGTVSVARLLDSSLQPSGSGAFATPAPPKSSRQTPSDSPFQVPDDDAATTPGAPVFDESPRENPGDNQGAPLIGWLILAMFPLGALGLVVLVIVLIVRSARPPQCPHCKTSMQLLPEFEEDTYLSDVQQLEESLGGREWNVWRCPKDGFQAIMKHDKWLSSISDCPRCGNRTVTSQSQTLRYANEYQSGVEQTTHTCHNPHCRNRWTTQRTIPRVQPVIIVSSGGGFGGGFGGSSGGRSSGGGGSSGGGSFGGGHSSGGGASGGW